MADEQKTEPAKTSAPTVFDPFESGAGGFLEFLLPLHREFTPRQRHLIAKRERAAY